MSPRPNSRVEHLRVGATEESWFMRSRVVTRGLAHVPAEGRAEGAGRAITDALRNQRDSEVLTAEQIPGDGHAPSKQVFHRSQSHDTRKPLEKRRARKCRLLRQLRHRPRTREL